MKRNSEVGESARNVLSRYIRTELKVNNAICMTKNSLANSVGHTRFAH